MKDLFKYYVALCVLDYHIIISSGFQSVMYDLSWINKLFY